MGIFPELEVGWHVAFGGVGVFTNERCPVTVSPTNLDLKGPRARREMRYLALSPIEGARWGQAALVVSAYLLMYIFFRCEIRSGNLY